MREKTPLLAELVCFQIKDFWLEVFYHCEKLHLSQNLCYTMFYAITMFYTINSSPMPATMSVYKLVLVLSNYQTCTFPLKIYCCIFSRSDLDLIVCLFGKEDIYPKLLRPNIFHILS